MSVKKGYEIVPITESVPLLLIVIIFSSVNNRYLYTKMTMNSSDAEGKTTYFCATSSLLQP
jgi:hypothetical protein